MTDHNADSRPHDVVLWGATGFTGRLVAKHLVRHGGGLRLALGGRSRRRLEEVRAELAAFDPEASRLPLVLADAFDATSLRKMVAKTAVVCSTVGPYSRYGHELVAACVESGTHYCDLTGEVPFIRRTIDDHHLRAGAAGVRIVHSCGFDSVPSDLGTWMLQQEAVSRLGGPLHRVTLALEASSGGFSGGTVASMLDVVERAADDRGVRRLLADPYALNPEGERSGPDRRDQTSVRFAPLLGSWTGPFLMAAINTRIVRRSNALLGWPYGRDFRYSEVTAFGRGAAARMKAMVVTAALGAFTAAVTFRPTRSLLQRTILPDPGEGPDEKARQRGFFRMRLVGSGSDEEVLLQARVAGDHDPGYGQTAVMLGESALCLALDDLDSPGGVLTPAAAMAQPLLDRLRARAMTFEVLDSPTRA